MTNDPLLQLAAIVAAVAAGVIAVLMGARRRLEGGAERLVVVAGDLRLRFPGVGSHTTLKP